MENTREFKLSDFRFDNVKFNDFTHKMTANAHLVEKKDLTEIFSLDPENGEHVSSIQAAWDRYGDYVDLEVVIFDSDLCEMDRGIGLTTEEKDQLKQILSDMFAEEYGESIEEYDPDPDQDEDNRFCPDRDPVTCGECWQNLFDPDGCPYA